MSSVFMRHQFSASAAESLDVGCKTRLRNVGPVIPRTLNVFVSSAAETLGRQFFGGGSELQSDVDFLIII